MDRVVRNPVAKCVFVAVLCAMALLFTYSSNSSAPHDPRFEPVPAADAATAPPTASVHMAATKAKGDHKTVVRAPAGKHEIHWESSYQSAQAAARRTGKVVMIDFYAQWCTACKALDAYTYKDERVIAESRHTLNIRLDSDVETELAKRYEIYSLPTILWVDGHGKVVARVEGVGSIDDFVASMQSARAVHKSPQSQPSH